MLTYLHFHALLLEIFRLRKFGVNKRFFGFPPLRGVCENFRLLNLRCHADVHRASNKKISHSILIYNIEKMF